MFIAFDRSDNLCSSNQSSTIVSPNFFFTFVTNFFSPYFISKYRSLINQYQFILPQKLLGCIGTTSRSSNMPLVDASERRKSSARSNTLLGNINTYNTYNNNNNNNNNNGIQSFQSEMECACD